MLTFTAEPIRYRPGQLPKRTEEPFQPGELYTIRYMGQPAFVTVMDRTPEAVVTWAGTFLAEEFAERVLFSLGRRCQFLGFWLPWARLNPMRIITSRRGTEVGENWDFWQPPHLSN